MIEGLIISLFTELILLLILEFLKWRWRQLRVNKRTELELENDVFKTTEVEETPEDIKYKKKRSKKIRFSVLRVIGSLGLGFAFSAIISGILEAELEKKIEIGSLTMILLMIFGTIGFWLILSIKDWQKKN